MCRGRPKKPTSARPSATTAIGDVLTVGVSEANVRLQAFASRSPKLGLNG